MSCSHPFGNRQGKASGVSRNRVRWIPESGRSDPGISSSEGLDGAEYLAGAKDIAGVETVEDISGVETVEDIAGVVGNRSG